MSICLSPPSTEGYSNTTDILLVLFAREHISTSTGLHVRQHCVLVTTHTPCVPSVFVLHSGARIIHPHLNSCDALSL